MSESEDTQDSISHDDIASHLREELDWPQFFVSGEDSDVEDFVPAYYRVDGPNAAQSNLSLVLSQLHSREYAPIEIEEIVGKAFERKYNK